MNHFGIKHVKGKFKKNFFTAKKIHIRPGYNLICLMKLVDLRKQQILKGPYELK